MDTHIAAAGWYNSPSHNGWKEYKSVALDGVTPINVSSRSYGVQLSDSQAAAYTKSAVLGGWNPQP
jgi:hypothetical protein